MESYDLESQQGTYQRAIQLCQQGQIESAKAILLQLIREFPDFHPAIHTLGAISFQEGQFTQAAHYLDKALQLEPENPEYLFHYGYLFLQTNQGEKALRLFKMSHALDLNYLPPRQKLFDYYYALGLKVFDKQSYLQAKEYFELALTYKDDSSELYLSLATVHYRLSQFTEAIFYNQAALKLNPDFVEAHLNLVYAYFQQNQSEAISFHIRKILSLKPEYEHALLSLASIENLSQSSIQVFDDILSFSKGHNLRACISLAIIYARLSDVSKATQYFNQAKNIAPRNTGIMLQEAFVLPYIVKNKQDLLYWRQRLSKSLNKLSQKIKRNKIQTFDNMPILPNFMLAYHGIESKGLLVKTAEVMTSLYQKVAVLPARIQRQQSTKIRLGFVSTFFYDHSVYHCYKNLLYELIIRDDFELYCISFENCRQDQMTRYLKDRGAQFLILKCENDLYNIQQVLALGLDILVYTDIGLEPETYRLALNRLAPVQCVLAGHPITTGISTIDYFISGRLYEDERASQYYSENLLLLDHLVGVNYDKPEIPQNIPSKSELGLPERGNLYVCPMTLIKVHPDFDMAIKKILEQDPEAYVVFFKSEGKYLYHSLILRFKKLMPELMDRIVFLSWLPKNKFLAVLLHANIILDTFHFGGGNTCFLALGLGVPIVTWPGQFYRGRACYGLYQYMQINDCIADSQETYVNLACQIATDAALRKKISQKILSRNEILFNNMKGIEQILDFFSSVVKQDY